MKLTTPAQCIIALQKLIKLYEEGKLTYTELTLEIQVVHDHMMGMIA